MRILFFSPYFYPHRSGLTILPHTVLDHWSQEHQVTVLTFQFQSSLPKEEKLNNLHIYRLPFLFKVSKGFISPSTISYFSSFIKKSDICITNLPNVEGIPFAYQAKHQQKKLIAQFHCQVNLGNDFPKPIINSVLNRATKYQLAQADTIIGTSNDYLNNCTLTTPFINKWLCFL